MELEAAPIIMGQFVFGGIGRDRKPVERTRTEYPYSFDDYLTYERPGAPEANNSLYTDRITRDEPEKVERLLKQHFKSVSHYWAGRSPEKIEAFLRDFCEAPELRLVRIWACCDKASGAEHWQFEFRDPAFTLPGQKSTV